MPRAILKNESIVDYIDALLDAAALREEEIMYLFINKLEWGMLRYCIKINNNGCAEKSTVISDTSILYDSIHVIYDGSENMSSEYVFMLLELKLEIDRARRQLGLQYEIPIAPVEATDSPVSSNVTSNNPVQGGYTDLNGAPLFNSGISRGTLLYNL